MEETDQQTPPTVSMSSITSSSQMMEATVAANTAVTVANEATAPAAAAAESAATTEVVMTPPPPPPTTTVACTQQLQQQQEVAVSAPVDARGPPPDLALREGEAALSAWEATARKVRQEAEDLLYYAEQLWSEDKHAWNSAKYKVFHDLESVELFDQEMRNLNQKQSPVWDVIMGKAAVLRAQLEEPHKRVKTGHEHIKKALEEDPHDRKHLNPLAKVFGKTALHEDQQELHHQYRCKMIHQFLEADDEYNALCAYPEGLLTRINLLRVNAIKEGAHLAEIVHRKKGQVRTIDRSPNPTPPIV